MHEIKCQDEIKTQIIDAFIYTADVCLHVCMYVCMYVYNMNYEIKCQDACTSANTQIIDACMWLFNVY